MRAYSWIGHVTSCNAGKRSANGAVVNAGQMRLSNGCHGREQPGEQNGSASDAPAHLKPPAGRA
jgi:hypothetical protein